MVISFNSLNILTNIHLILILDLSGLKRISYQVSTKGMQRNFDFSFSETRSFTRRKRDRSGSGILV